MSQGNWGGGGWGPGGGGGGYGPPPGGFGPPPAGGWGQPPGGYGSPPGGYGPPPGPMPPGYPPGYTPPTGGVVAWEDQSQSVLARWWGTVREVCFNARAFHAAAAQNEDPWPSVSFAMVNGGITGGILGVLVAITYMLFGGLGALLASSIGGSSASSLSTGIFGFMSVLGFGVALLYPVMGVVAGLLGPFVWGGIHHLMLVLMGGATRSYGHTVRVVGYTHAAYLWAAVPLVGPFATLVLSVISLITGLEEAHKCGTGKAVLAVFLPLGICCTCYCGSYMMAGIFGGMSRP